MLEKTMESILSMDVPSGLRWEVLIIDNNSTDETKDVVGKVSASSPVPIRYILEEEQGLSFARNRGVLESRGEIIAFTDDDVIVDPFWLRNILRGFENSDAACIGGKIHPIWESSPPEWLTVELHDNLALLDCGEKVLKMTKPRLWGANFSVRRNMFEKYGDFNSSLGRTPTKLFAGEETSFIGRLIDAGESVYYFPDVFVHHYVPKKRLNKAYFRKWWFDQGELEARETEWTQYRNLFGIPIFKMRELLVGAAIYIWHEITRSRDSFIKQLSVVNLLGFVYGKARSRIFSR